MKRILVPVDFSPATKAVIKTAVSLAEPAARITLLHNLVPPLVTTDYGIGLGELQESVAIAEKHARKQLDHLVAVLARKGFAADSVLTHGGAPGSILEQARARKTDAIVLGSHGHTAFYDLVVGSTTNAVIKKAPCPVVVVPPAAAKAVAKPVAKKR